MAPCVGRFAGERVGRTMKKNNSINFTSEQDRINYIFQKCMENYDDPSITFVEHIGYVCVVTDKETSCEIFQGKTYMPKIEAQHRKVAEIRELKKIEGVTVKHSRIKLNQVRKIYYNDFRDVIENEVKCWSNFWRKECRT